jgi:hypothetical protein
MPEMGKMRIKDHPPIKFNFVSLLGILSILLPILKLIYRTVDAASNAEWILGKWNYIVEAFRWIGEQELLSNSIFIITGFGLLWWSNRSNAFPELTNLGTESESKDIPISDNKLTLGQIEIEFQDQFSQKDIEIQGTQIKGNRMSYWAEVHNRWHNPINGAQAYLEKIELLPPLHSQLMKPQLFQMNAYQPLMQKDNRDANLHIPAGGSVAIIIASYNDVREEVSIGNVRFIHHPDNIHRLFVSVFYNGKTVAEKRFLTRINKTSLGKKFIVSVDTSEY